MDVDTPTRSRREGGLSRADASRSNGAAEILPITPDSQLMTRSRKRRRSRSPSDAQHSCRDNKVRVLEPLPPSALLLALPKLFIVPPNHKVHIASYIVVLNALRVCSALGTLTPDVECRVWMSLAEVGFKVVCAGWSQDEDYTWAKGLEDEVCNTSL